MGTAVAADPVRWTEAFQASPAAYSIPPNLAKVIPGVAPQRVNGTVRFTLVLASGGNAVRIRLSNEDGSEPLVIGAASVAIVGGMAKPLRFGGQSSISIPPGAPALSDPVAVAVKAFDRLQVSTYLPQDTPFTPLGGAGMDFAPGDQTLAASLRDAKALFGRPLVSGAAVATERPLPVVVTLGDSITDGLRANPGAARGYPEVLARRLAGLPVAHRKSVINAGIAGNRILTSGWGDGALVRFDRDVLRIPNVSHVVLLEGINDIGFSGAGMFGSGSAVSPDDIIAGYRQIIARAHARGVKVVGGTLLPFKGAPYYTPDKEKVRAAVNHWIRTSGEFDGIFDFEEIMRDPMDPLKLRADLDSGDHLHPGDAGYKAMGNGVDIKLLR
jgi:lysophospholipase L1-like esterase